MNTVNLQKGDKVGPWTICGKLGEGAYGAVYSAVCDSLGNVEYALKVAPISKNKKKNQAAILIQHERTIQRIRLDSFRKDYIEVCHFPRSSKPVKDLICGTSDDGKIQYLAMEKFNLGLTDYLRQWGGALPPQLVYSIAAQSIAIIQFLHRKCVIYNDIKVDNFMLRERPEGYQLVIVDMGAAEVKAAGKILDSNGPRGTPLFTSINSNRGGKMYFSDDMSGLGYMFAYLLLGSLPWGKCKSEEEILKQKEECVIDTSLDRFPELLSFIKAFRTATTDQIAYAKWIDAFKAAAKRIDPSMDTRVLPKSQTQSAKRVKTAQSEQPSQPSQPAKPVKRVKTAQPAQPVKQREPPQIVDLTEELPEKKRKVQDTIDQSPLSFKQTTQRRQDGAKVVEAARRPTRVQPPRKCKKC
ncbi:hypothetical protein WA556_003986, partial [Blastocystis sp. ATCC 50177/Nand II]